MGSQSTAAVAQRPKSATAIAVWLLGLTIFSAVAPMTAHARWYDPERGVFMSQSPLAPALEHEYVFNFADPINFADPTGLWGEDVHYDSTYNQCLRMGGSPPQCALIAGYDNGFDTKYNPFKPWNTNKHFPTSLGEPYGEALDAIANCNYEAFGEALHRVQDFWSHSAPGYWGTNNNIYRHHTFQGHSPDAVYKHLDLYTRAMNFTRHLLTLFFENCSGKNNDCD